MEATIEVAGLRQRFGAAQALDGMTFTALPWPGDWLRRPERRGQARY
jgi:hypothetical protein